MFYGVFIYLFIYVVVVVLMEICVDQSLEKHLWMVFLCFYNTLKLLVVLVVAVTCLKKKKKTENKSQSILSLSYSGGWNRGHRFLILCYTLEGFWVFVVVVVVDIPIYICFDYFSLLIRKLWKRVFDKGLRREDLCRQGLNWLRLGLSWSSGFHLLLYFSLFACDNNSAAFTSSASICFSRLFRCVWGQKGTNLS